MSETSWPRKTRDLHDHHPDSSARYEAMAEEKLGSACARWLATGELG